ncbi:hypothetical protein Cni_G23706 [Canna indica]|uniref:Uncharacterized protein n=1 Tax=Canna indica TaxID=4628 RepID=A0AAQ3QNV0_9LILI|nr:hypothetical protein Cni_G23706 [Canna indica]
MGSRRGGAQPALHARLILTVAARARTSPSMLEIRVPAADFHVLRRRRFAGVERVPVVVSDMSKCWNHWGSSASAVMEKEVNAGAAGNPPAPRWSVII